MKWPVYNITGSLFKRRIGFSYQKVVKVSAPQVASEKVTNTVGTFLTDYSSSIKKLRSSIFISHHPTQFPEKFNIFTKKHFYKNFF